MTGVSSGLQGLQLFVLIVALAVAAAWDTRTREVPDRLWQVAGLAGAAIGALLLIADGLGAVLLWLFIAGFALQHLFAWDERWNESPSRLPEIIEIGLYLGAGLLLLAVGWVFGVGSSGVPVPAVAAYVTVLLARGLFEARVLYGGADAKAVITLGVLLPLWAGVPWGQSAPLGSILALTPFALTALINGAVLALSVPIALAVRNARRGEFSLPKGFLGSSLPVGELPTRFVWLHDPRLDGLDVPTGLDTAAEDRRLRTAQAAELSSRGIERVWVTPQIPLVLFLALGAGLALAIGNILLDLVVRL